MDGENIALLVIIGLVAFIIFFFNLPNIFGSLIGLPEEKRKAQSAAIECEKKEKELKVRENALWEKECSFNRQVEGIESLKEEAEEYTKKVISRVDKYIEQKCNSFPFLAGMMADFLTLHYEKSAQYLQRKKHPAHTEAFRIRDLASETKKIISEKKVLEYKLAYIEKLFPSINDIFDSGFAEEGFALETADDTDRTRLFLSEEEYRSLSTIARNQLALDRYVASRKSRWQVGRDYEMYIGLCIEKRGFSVQYTGIIQKLEDMGRDLIATKGRSCYIVQCKNWSQEKTIHEKHVFQLYGTSILYQIDHPHASVQPVFVTSAELSETAKKVAEVLGVTVLENIALKEFPRIKCNINRTSGMRIYHLPFDQQYDRTVIEENHGEFYAFTVDEAESKGFRRAWKHYH